MLADRGIGEWGYAALLQLFGLKNMMGAHCTGINALYVRRELMRSKRKLTVMGAIEDSFSLNKGVKTGFIARKLIGNE